MMRHAASCGSPTRAHAPCRGPSPPDGHVPCNDSW
jgi:hypothetical protein